MTGRLRLLSSGRAAPPEEPPVLGRRERPATLPEAATLRALARLREQRQALEAQEAALRAELLPTLAADEVLVAGELRALRVEGQPYVREACVVRPRPSLRLEVA